MIYIDIISFYLKCVRFGMCRHCIIWLANVLFFNMGWSCRYETAFYKDWWSLCEMKHSNDKIYYESYEYILYLNIRITVIKKINPMIETNDGQEPYLLRQIYCNELETYATPDSKVHGANMGPIRGRQDPGGPHVGPIKVAIWDINDIIIGMVEAIFHPRSR